MSRVQPDGSRLVSRLTLVSVLLSGVLGAMIPDKELGMYLW